jgi:hypothetical protein
MRHEAKVMAVAVLLVATACGSESNRTVATTGAASGDPDAAISSPTTGLPETTAPPAANCANVIEVVVSTDGEAFTFATTVRSGDTGWDKYADRWEVRDGDGKVLGVRELAHPHETEQPFTRSLPGVEIAAPVSEVVVVARDSVLGYCGASITVTLPGR